jgi:putative effector of murein hydrolase
MLQKYRTGKLTLTGAGAGDILLFLLGPAVVSLACQMYDRRKLICENFGEIATAVLVSSLGGLFGTAFAVRTLVIGNPAVRLSLLSRNITSPLAMAVASILGGDVSVAVSMVVVTGLIGANFGSAILNGLGITDAVARGMGIGAAAHGLGTAAFSNEEDAFPFAAIAMALTASACTVLVSIPVIKKAILQLALGW